MFEYLGSDGDAPRRQALTQFCTARNLREQYDAWKSQYGAASVGDPKKPPEKPRAVKIYEAVFEAVLFDYSTGPHEARDAALCRCRFPHPLLRRLIVL